MLVGRWPVVRVPLMLPQWDTPIPQAKLRQETQRARSVLRLAGVHPLLAGCWQGTRIAHLLPHWDLHWLLRENGLNRPQGYPPGELALTTALTHGFNTQAQRLLLQPSPRLRLLLQLRR